MADKILKTRIPQKIDTTDNWNNSSLILKNGEIGIEEFEDGSKKFKFGDGKNLWKNLAYATGDSLNNILDGIANGSIRTSLSTQESIDYKLGTAAFAEGQGTKASGNFSHSEGFNTTSSGAYSHSEGRQTIASGSVSHAEGTETIASGIRSHASGYGTVAKGENQTVIGKYNIQDDNNEFAFIVGNGTTSLKSNAFTIDWNGVVKANAKKLATEEYVQNNGGKIDTVKVNDQEVEIKDKAVNILVPTKTSELTNDSNFLTQHQDITGKANLSQVVRHDTSQLLSEEQKSLARANIGAGTSDFDGNYSSLTGIPVIPTKTSELENDSGFLTEHQDLSGLAQKATTLAGYGIIDAYTKTAADTKIKTEIEKLDKTDSAVVGKYVSSVSETNGIISVTRADLPTGIDYTVEISESTPEGYAKSYTITQEATGLNTTINIPKDMVVESGIVETKLESGPWGLAGTYLVLTLANATSDRIYIDVSTLIEYVTSGSTSSDMVQIAISQDHKVTASIKDGSITKAKLASDIQTSLNKADSALQSVPNATATNYGLVKVIDLDSPTDTDSVVTYGFYQLALEGFNQALEGKVDKVTGKQLSTNDYTTAEKTKLTGIAAGAEVNVQSDWNQSDNTKDDFIKNKPTIPTIPTKVSAFENDAGYLTSHQSLANYVTLNTVQTISAAKTFGAILTASAGLSVTGNITATGTITGSKVYNAVWNDYAEWFEKEDLTEEFTPGDICAWNKNGVTKAKHLNDKKVVGVVSNSYGHILGGENLKDMEDNKEKFVPIGLKGRVKCKVIGPVEVGDLITTSNLEGIGIVDNNCPTNSIVGKALENDYTVSIKTITILV